MTKKTLPFANKVWIFQCDPKKYEIKEALEDQDVKNEFHWKVKQHRQEIAKGHFGMMWISGRSAGIYAITELISNPGEFNESEAEKKYWKDPADEEGIQYRVKMRLIDCIVPLTKEKIKNTPGLESLKIITMPRGTNFPVSTEEWKI
ncbi:MAG TPA: EVE domain-containing protein, partial [Prolixibacteraceae bacterium]